MIDIKRLSLALAQLSSEHCPICAADDGWWARMTPEERVEHVHEVLDAAMRSLEPPNGCRHRLAEGQYWAFCGEKDMGHTLPALCRECGGEFERA